MEKQLIPVGYKQTEVGVIPEDWEVREFGELVNYIKGYPFKSSEYTGDGVRIIRVSDTTYDSIQDDGAVFVSEESAKNYKKWQLRESDLIFSTVGSKPPMYDSLVGKAIIVSSAHDGSLLNQNAVLIRSKIGSVSFQNLLLNHFRTERYISHIEIIYRGNANQASITLDNLFEFKLPLPCDREEQTAIANALSDVDALIAALEKLINKKCAIKTAAMQQLLTGKKRLPPFDQLNTGYKQTELGEIPGDWDVVEFGHMITEFKGGANLSPSDFDEVGMWVIPKSGVTWGGVLKIKNSDQQFCRLTVINKYASNIVDQDFTIIVLRDLVPSGPNIGLIVNIKEPNKYLLAQGVYAFKLKDKFSSVYLAQLSNSLEYRKLMQSILVGSTQVHIRSSTLKDTKLAMPSFAEQTAIANVLSDMDKDLEALQQRLHKTQQIKQGMMQELLTGRTRLI